MRKIVVYLLLGGIYFWSMPGQAANDPCSPSGFVHRFVTIKPTDLKVGAYGFAGYDLEAHRIQEFVEECPVHSLDTDLLIQNLEEQNEFMKKSLAHIVEQRVAIPSEDQGFSREESLAAPDAIQRYALKYVESAFKDSKRP